MRGNPKKFVTQVLGSLKKQHGCTVYVYKVGEECIDWDTGQRDITSTCVEVDNCIVLPVKVNSEVVQSISYVSSNKSFVQGGYYGTGKRNFIFDFAQRRGLSPTYKWEASDWIIVEDSHSGVLQRYDVERFEALHFGAGWLVTGVRVEGVTPQRVVKQPLTHTLQLRLNQTVTTVVE